MVHKEIVKISP